MLHLILKNAFAVTRWYILSAVVFILFISLFSFRSNQAKILIYAPPGGTEETKAAQLVLIRQLAINRKAEVEVTTRASRFVEDSLKQYSAVVFLQAPLTNLDFRQQADFERYVQAGGGFLALNAATDTVRNWPWYQTLNQARLKAAKTPWQAKYDGGRVYFAQLGAASTKNLEKTLSKGLKFAIGDNDINYSKVNTMRVPEANRFVTEVLDTYMYEPMEMVIFKDGRVLYLERRGNVKLYDPKKKKSSVIAKFDVSITGNYEDGMLGVALDPDFEKNNWIYINYSPAGNIPKQNVSRFEMRGDSLIMSSEKIVLEIPVQRETCCHSGGHLEFGPNGDLYISTGDNTSSKESDGFTPIDERPGRAPFDAQKSSGNTNSLTGKILRIHPEPDGSYTIPKGNLFPPGTPKTRPEIYTMGTRNAFRFTVDDRTGYVYWGDVGPDGGKSSERGPQSYDEWNQARKAGNFGWPYFVGDNFAYADFDFATNKIGAKFNPEKPENFSPNNTGLNTLPPAQKPMIWYPYSESKEFPTLGKGSRSAMAGPVYYAEDYPKETRFPEYYDGKLFIYEWARSWVQVASFDKDWNLTQIEPFLPTHPWYKPIDIKFGPDGSLYVLEYGANYFAHNPDSRLIKITYAEGNRQPVAQITASKTVGAAPLTVNLSAAGSYDYDKNDKLNYTWSTGAGANGSSSGYQTNVTYTKPGVYRPSVTVTDAAGKQATAEIEIKVGNEPPQVEVSLGGANKSFYFDNQKINYKVNVTDKEDGTLQKGIDPGAVFVSFDYLKEGKDLALLASNTQMTGGVQFLKGKTLIAGSDCKSCHDLKTQSIGPSYVAVAERYKGNKNALDMLATKILKGGNGNWGKNMMAAHPQHNQAEATEMVKYILSLSDKQNIALPLQGTLTASDHQNTNSAGMYIIRANYTDKGNPVTGALTGSQLLSLRSPKVQAEDFDMHMQVGRRHVDGTDFSFVTDIQNGSYIAFKDIDLTGISSILFRAGARNAGSRIEVRKGTPDGKLVGTASLPAIGNKDTDMQLVRAVLNGAEGRQDLYLVFRNDNNAKGNLLNLDWLYFDNGKQAPPKE